MLFLLFAVNSVACAVGPSLTTSSTDFSFQNLFFWNLFWIFSGRNHSKINYLPHSESKSYQINSIKSCSSRSFQQHQRHIPIPPNFLKLRFNLIFSEEIIQYSRTFAPQVQTSWNQSHAPLLVESFPKRPRTRSEASWFGGSHNYKQNKTNKLPSFIDRCFPIPNLFENFCLQHSYEFFVANLFFVCGDYDHNNPFGLDTLQDSICSHSNGHKLTK